MSFFTIFLAVLIAALFAGNILLSIANARKKSAFESVSANNGAFQIATSLETSIVPDNENAESVSEKFLIADARIAALNNKVLMAHERLQRIEAMLMRLGGQQQQALPDNSISLVDFAALAKKIDNLSDYKANSEIEIAAIKDALREKGILSPPAKKNSNSFAVSAEDRRAHEIVFRAAKKH